MHLWVLGTNKLPRRMNAATAAIASCSIIRDRSHTIQYPSDAATREMPHLCGGKDVYSYDRIYASKRTPSENV